MKSNAKLIARLTILFIAIITLDVNNRSFGQRANAGDGMMDVGVGFVDITPDDPIRLAGYGSRTKSESDGIIQRLQAKALAFGRDPKSSSVLITVDLVGITERITTKLVQALSKKTGLDAAQIVICASHTHGGPEIGNLLNILQYRDDRFSDSLLALDQLVHIAQYTEELSEKLEQVALAALKDRRPAFVSWGQGQAAFAANRRTKDGPVDHALPLLRVTNPNGTLRAVLVNYACHGTTLDGNVNNIHGDWIGEAQRLIEANHPGCIAMVSIGCGGDANPQPRGTAADVQMHGQEISDNVDKLLATPLQPLTALPVGTMKWIKLPFSKIPTVPELIKLTEDKTVKGYYARLALDRVERGEKIPAELNYPVQTWNFGNKLVMVNLGGEVVVDYSIRLKNELGAEHLWINAYSNDVPCYVASRRVIREGGYEGETSMYYYDKPSPFAEEVEDIIVSAVHEIMPPAFTEKRDTLNHQELILRESDGAYHLSAAHALAVGPTIKYMPEWKAFGWFTVDDSVEWNVKMDQGGKYDVYLQWSVSDNDAGKQFVFISGDRKIKGKVGKTGSWFTYTRKKIGTVNLPAGPRKMVFKSNSVSDKGAMLDLAEITLVPVK